MVSGSFKLWNMKSKNGVSRPPSHLCTVKFWHWSKHAVIDFLLIVFLTKVLFCLTQFFCKNPLVKNLKVLKIPHEFDTYNGLSQVRDRYQIYFPTFCRNCTLFLVILSKNMAVWNCQTGGKLNLANRDYTND